MSQRLNARIDDQLARKVKQLRARTGKSTTRVIKDAVEAYYERALGSSSVESLTPFIGCADGSSDLSRTYKSKLTESLRKKSRA